MARRPVAQAVRVLTLVPSLSHPICLPRGYKLKAWLELDSQIELFFKEPLK